MSFKKKIIGGVIFLIIIGGGYYWYSAGKTGTTDRTMPRVIRVSTGSLLSTIKATGNISAMEESTLSFARDGIVSAIYKTEGDAVSPGDVIAAIDAGTANLDIKNAEINLSNAQNNYNNVINGGTAVEKLRSKNTLSDSRAQLTLLEKQYENLLIEKNNAIRNAETSITSLETKLELAKGEYEYAEKNISTDTTSNNLERDVANANALLEQTYQTISSSINEVKEAMLTEQKYNSIYYDLSAEKPEIKAQAETLYETTVDLAETFEETMLANKQKTLSVTELVDQLDKSRTILTNLNNLTSLIISEYKYSIIGAHISDAEVTSKSSSMQSLGSAISGKLGSVGSTIATLKGYGSTELQALSDKNTLTSKKSAVTSATNDLQKAKQDLEATKQSYIAKILSAQQGIVSQKSTISLNEASYADVVGATTNEAISAGNSVKSAQISLEKSKIGLKDYQIIASFSGTVEDIPWKVGESAEMNEGILVANKDTYKIELSLDQIDIVKVKEGMEAKVMLDAFADKTFTGTVTAISATPTITSGVVSYTATVGLSITGITVMSNMTTTVTIIIASKEDIILIPSGAITSENGKSYVNIQSGQRPGASTEKREVTVGTVSDGKTEILSGLTIGEMISYTSVSIPTTRTSSSSTTTRSPTMGGGMGGGMGGPPAGF